MIILALSEKVLASIGERIIINVDDKWLSLSVISVSCLGTGLGFETKALFSLLVVILRFRGVSSPPPIHTLKGLKPQGDQIV
jgi:hypothetical protein